MQRSLLKAHLEHITDVTDSNGTLLRYEELFDWQRNEVTQMLFNSLKAAIPKLWLAIIRADPNDTELSQQDKFKKLQSPTKTFYWLLVNKK